MGEGESIPSVGVVLSTLCSEGLRRRNSSSISVKLGLFSRLCRWMVDLRIVFIMYSSFSIMGAMEETVVVGE